jgi:hypothetical protein
VHPNAPDQSGNAAHSGYNNPQPTAGGANTSGGTYATGGGNTAGGTYATGGASTTSGGNSTGGNYSPGGATATPPAGGAGTTGGGNTAGGTYAPGGANTTSGGNTTGGTYSSGGTTTGGSNTTGGNYTTGGTTPGGGTGNYGTVGAGTPGGGNTTGGNYSPGSATATPPAGGAGATGGGGNTTCGNYATGGATSTPSTGGASTTGGGNTTGGTYGTGTQPSPPTGTDSENCITTAILDLTKNIAAAEQAKANKTDLEALLPKAKKASGDYNQDAYQKLLDRWTKLDQDGLAYDLLPKITCTVKCWRDLLNDRVCKLLGTIISTEKCLWGSRDPCVQPPDTAGLYDQQYYLTQKVAFLKLKADWSKKKLDAWEKPADTLKAVLDVTEALKAKVSEGLGKADAATLVWDVWMKLLPLHFLIAPRDATSKIKQEHMFCCAIDMRDPNHPSGRSLLERMLGMQPYIFVPGDYYKILCPLIADYTCAKTTYADAAGALEAKKNEVTSAEKSVDDKTKSFDKDAKTELLKPLPPGCGTCKDGSQKPPDNTGAAPGNNPTYPANPTTNSAPLV